MPRRSFPRVQIAAVIKRGRKVHARHCWLKWAQGKHGACRLAFAISRKNVRSSVRRNLIKRHHRETARGSLAFSSGVDVVVFAKPSVARLPAAEIRADALKLWQALENSLPQPASG